MKLNKVIIIFIVAGLVTSACHKDTLLISLQEYSNPHVGNTSTYPLNGQYEVRYDTAHIVGTDTTWVIDPYNLLHCTINVYNTASNNGDSIWVDNSYINYGTPSITNLFVKCKVACNVPKLAFGSANNSDINLANPDSALVGGVMTAIPDPVTFTNGHLILNGGKSPYGIVCDSIVMYVRFSKFLPKTLFRESGIRWDYVLADEGGY